jgi:hypothetical protein
MGGGEESQSSGYKLNITDDIINKIIPSVTLLVIMSITMQRHHAICLFEYHCNSFGIYRENFFVGIFTNVLYR